MKVVRNEIDSEVLGATVVEIHEAETSPDLAAAEATWVKDHAPHYAVAKLPIEALAAIQALERLGFGYVETQLRLRGKLNKSFYVERFPYEYRPVASAEELEQVLDLAEIFMGRDRFSLDPDLGAGLSGQRYRRYVERSYHQPDEHVNLLQNKNSGEVVGFGTQRDLGDGKALLLIGGVPPAYQGTGLGAINDMLGYEALKQRGIGEIVTHVSAANIPILNLEIVKFGYKVDAGFIVLRKLYK